MTPKHALQAAARILDHLQKAGLLMSMDSERREQVTRSLADDLNRYRRRQTHRVLARFQDDNAFSLNLLVASYAEPEEKNGTGL